MFKKFLVIATLAAGLISTQASAAFVATDWKSTGDKLATLDTETGLEWLDIYQTYGYTIKSMKTALLNGQFHGWRLATYEEVMQLWEGFLNRTIVRGAIAPLRSIGDPAGSYLGSRTYGGYKMTFGLSESLSGVSYLVGTSGIYGGSFYSQVEDTHPNAGVYLVSDGGTTLSSINDPSININNPNAPINMADVSAPAGLAAAGVLMLMLGARRRAA